MYCRYHSFKILKYNIIQEFILIQGEIRNQGKCKILTAWARGGAGDGGG